MADPLASPRTTLKRRPQRGSHDLDLICSIIDEALVSHVSFVDDEGAPVVIPMAHARLGDALYLHGARANRMLSRIVDGPVCVAFTLLDGLVLARSAFHHSVNYRSAVLFGRGVDVHDDAQKRASLDALVARMAKGRERAARPPTAAELAQTRVVAIHIVEASAKVRTGPPVDDEADMAHPCWAGVVPLSLVEGAPIPDAACLPGMPAPEPAQRTTRS